MKGKLAIATTFAIAALLVFAGVAMAIPQPVYANKPPTHTPLPPTATRTPTLVPTATPLPAKVTVCHKTGSESHPYSKVVVSVHSTDDASGLNGHGDHELDAWLSFIFNGVVYPGQNVGLFGTVIDTECALIPPTPTSTPVTPTATATASATATATATEEPTATATATEEPTATATATQTEPPVTDTPIVTEPPITEEPGITPTATSTPTVPRKPVCTSDQKIWVWELITTTGQHLFLRDLGYDGTYDSPGYAQQCYYFGCNLKVERVWGSWVTACDGAEYSYWAALPRYNGGGKCPLN